MQPLKPPVQLGEVTEEELKAYDGSDPEKPLLMAIKGQIYDVSQGRYMSVGKRSLFWLLIMTLFVFCDFWVMGFGLGGQRSLFWILGMFRFF